MNQPNLQRGFFCIPLPDSVRNALAALQRRLMSAGHNLSFSSSAYAHITLVFLGEVAASAVEVLTDRLDALGQVMAPFELAVGKGGFFGPKRSPKVLWVGVSQPPALIDLQTRLVRMAADAGICPENRPFHPHLTIARIRSTLTPAALTSIMPCINNTRFDEVPVDRVLFMNSLLNGSGPRYTTVHQIYLKGQHHG